MKYILIALILTISACGGEEGAALTQEEMLCIDLGGTPVVNTYKNVETGEIMLSANDCKFVNDEKGCGPILCKVGAECPAPECKGE